MICSNDLAETTNQTNQQEISGLFFLLIRLICGSISIF